MRVCHACMHEKTETSLKCKLHCIVKLWSLWCLEGSLHFTLRMVECTCCVKDEWGSSWWQWTSSFSTQCRCLQWQGGGPHSKNCPLGAYYHTLQDLSVRASIRDNNVICQSTVYDTSEEADEERGSSGKSFYMALWKTLFWLVNFNIQWSDILCCQLLKPALLFVVTQCRLTL